MKTFLYKLFNRAIKWNAFEAVVYQTVLSVHQIFLFSVSGCQLYGLIGILFAILYLSILLLNFGFDRSLAAFFIEFTESKKEFKKIFLNQLLIQFFLLSASCLTLIFFQNLIGNFFSSSFKCQILSKELWIILGSLIVFEGMKKSLRVLCELAFLNKYIAWIEICLIIFYVFLFWTGFYFFDYKVNLFLVFIPLIIQSIFSIVFFSYLIFNKIYNNISFEKKELNKDIVSRILKNRFANYGNQVSHIFFSGNFLIPFLSYNFGLVQISILKLTNNIVILFNVIMERTFGFTSGAFLSHVKNSSIAEKQNALNLATKKLFIILYGLSIFFIINFKTIINPYLKNIQISWLAIYFYLFIIIFENFFITFEQFFIVEEKTYYFFLLNLMSALTFYGLNNFIKLSLISSLLLLIAIRVVSFLILRIISSYKLKMILPYKIKLKYIILFGIVSLIFLVIFKSVL